MSSAICSMQGAFAAGRPRCQQQEEGVLVAMRMVLGLADAPALAHLLRQQLALVAALVDAAGSWAAAGSSGGWTAAECLGILLRAFGAEVRRCVCER